MSKNKIALIAGSSGLVGRELLLLLLESSEYEKVIALVRKKTDYHHPKLEQVETDFNKLDAVEASFKNVDDVFCCLGSTIKNAGSKAAFRKVDFEYPVALAEAAAKNECAGFYSISAMGADPKSRVFYNKVKGQMEEQISRLAIPTIVFFRPSLLIGYREEFRFGERLAIAVFSAMAFIFWGPLKNLKAIPVGKVATSMFKTAKLDNKGVHVILSGVMQ